MVVAVFWMMVLCSKVGNMWALNVSQLQGTIDCFPIFTFPEPVLPRVRTEGKKKTIVWLDSMHDMHGLRVTSVNAKFDMCTGIARNCEMLPHVITRYPRFTRNNLTIGPIQADAVLVMGTHLEYLPTPVRRDPDQVFVFVERENWLSYIAFERIQLKQSEVLLRDHMDYFNWTMTYRIDSDVFFPYGHISPKHNYQPPSLDYFGEIYRKKKYSVAWFVSHCMVGSKRAEFVAELRKHIDIHIYGLCGNLTCTDDDCFKKIIEEHKFILAFENTYYQNYITEKLFSVFEKNIVQVVRGGGLDYSLYGVPDGTVVDADSFQSPEALAETLHSIGSDKDLYIKYLRTKHRYFSVDVNRIRQSAYCNLCAKLNNINKWRKSYTHIGAWFSSHPFQKSFFYRKDQEYVDMSNERILRPIHDRGKQNNPLEVEPIPMH